LKVNGRGKVDKFPVILKIRGTIADGRQMAADWDNISKAVQDAMVKAKILPDDNLRYVSGGDVRLKRKNKNEYYIALVA
jgi:Holliday junction resolvase RusA-like endonuclease